MTQPLFLRSTMHEKIWGGNRLKEAFCYEIPSQQTGEFWAISAHPNGCSVINQGSYEGMRLDDLYELHPELFGNPDQEKFPLLVKILDANDWLSVQVHPDDAFGLANEGEYGKTECWYILEADPGAEIIYVHKATSKDQLDQLIDQQDWDGLLRKVSVKKGDFFFVPSGTIHAIGPGILILEIQQSSDTTYRIYDFDRKDANDQLRELHLDKAKQVISVDNPVAEPQVVTEEAGTRMTQLVTSDFFTVEKWEISESARLDPQNHYKLISIIDGQGQMEAEGQLYPIEKGQHFILPATLAQVEWTGDLSIVMSYV